MSGLPNYLRELTIAMLIVIVIFLIYTGAVVGLEDRADVGDMYGGLNTLFSGLALAALIVTLRMQMAELNVSRSEFAKSVEAQTDSARALASQIDSLESQNNSLRQANLYASVTAILKHENYATAEVRRLCYYILESSGRENIKDLAPWALVPNVSHEFSGVDFVTNSGILTITNHGFDLNFISVDDPDNIISPNSPNSQFEKVGDRKFFQEKRVLHSEGKFSFLVDRVNGATFVVRFSTFFTNQFLVLSFTSEILGDDHFVIGEENSTAL